MHNCSTKSENARVGLGLSSLYILLILSTFSTKFRLVLEYLVGATTRRLFNWSFLVLHDLKIYMWFCSCTTTILSKLLTSCLTAVKQHWIRYYDTVYERDGINYFWSIKNSNDVLNKFKSKNFQASKLSTFDFSTLYTTLPHHLIKDKLTDLINRTFVRQHTQYFGLQRRMCFFFFTSHVYNNHNLWSCQNVCDALVYLLDTILLDLANYWYSDGN